MGRLDNIFSSYRVGFSYCDIRPAYLYSILYCTERNLSIL